MAPSAPAPKIHPKPPDAIDAPDASLFPATVSGGRQARRVVGCGGGRERNSRLLFAPRALQMKAVKETMDYWREHDGRDCDYSQATIESVQASE